MKKGWEIKKLGEVCEYKSGTTISPTLEKDEGDVFYIKVGDMNLEGNEDFITTSSRFVDSIAINLNQIIPPGSIIFPKRGGAIATNKKRRIISPTIVDLNTMALVPSSIIDKDFLFFWFKQINLSELSNGTSIPQINNYSFDNVIIAYPKDKNEQKRIVSILDEAFAAIDQAKENVQRNLQNAKELFQNYVQLVFEKPEADWEIKKWGDLCHFVRGPFGGSLKKSVFKDDGYVVYEQKHAIHDHFNQLRYFIDEDKFNEMIRFEVKPGDIIMSCSGVTLGRVAIIPEGIKRGIINQALLKLTPKKNVSVDFLKYWLRSNIFQSIIFKYSGGAAIPNVPSVKILKEISIPFPSLEGQKLVVDSIENMLAETKMLEEKYQQKLDYLEELKKSILQKAFSGELTETIKELC